MIKKEDKKVIDLTHLIHETISVFPGAKTPSFTQVANHSNDGYQETNIEVYSHTGTHIDAPRHLFENRTSLDEISVSNFVGKAVVVDVKDCKQEISLDLVLKHPYIHEAEFILFYTGWDQYFETEQYWKDYPLLSIELCQWIKQRHLKGIGIDICGVDAIDDISLTRHRLLLEENDMIIIENLTNLNKLPIEEIIQFVALPLHYRNADGAMARVIAIFDE